jgi:hypothetical protein
LGSKGGGATCTCVIVISFRLHDVFRCNGNLFLSKSVPIDSRLPGRLGNFLCQCHVDSISNLYLCTL